MTEIREPRLTVAGLMHALKSGECTAQELTRQCLDQIARLEPTVGAFLTVDAEGAMRAAAESDRRRRAGCLLHPMDGVPYAVKDNFCTRGLRTTCGSRMLEHYLPPYDAEVVTLLRGAGCVLLGKLNMDEFSMGSSTRYSALGVTRNPRDPERVPGGSSGGAAAAVAAGEVPFAIGSDTGGSVRQPAAFCGVLGFKPTAGRISRFGMTAFAPSLDCVGIVANTAADAEMVFRLLADRFLESGSYAGNADGRTIATPKTGETTDACEETTLDQPHGSADDGSSRDTQTTGETNPYLRGYDGDRNGCFRTPAALHCPTSAPAGAVPAKGGAAGTVDDTARFNDGVPIGTVTSASAVDAAIDAPVGAPADATIDAKVDTIVNAPVGTPAGAAIDAKVDTIVNTTDGVEISAPASATAGAAPIASAAAVIDAATAANRATTGVDAGAVADVKGLRIAVAEDGGVGRISSDVARSIARAVDCLRQAGAVILPVELPSPEQALLCYCTLTAVEAASDLARFDGIRYGGQALGDERDPAALRGACFGAEVKRRILLGTALMTGDFRARYYEPACRIRKSIRSMVNRMFAQCDLILEPTVTAGAFRFDDTVSDLQMREMDLCTVYASLAGIPAVSVPVGEDGNRMPLGIQVMAAPMREDLVFRAAAVLESVGVPSKK